MNTVMRFVLISLICCILYSCEKYEDIVPYDSYIIKEGKHSSGERLNELDQEVLTYDIIFDESAMYTIDKCDQADVNKLFGFADCNSAHHENSARFGWRWYQDKLEILAYCYADGVVKFESVGTVELNKEYRYSIRMYDDHYTFRIHQLPNEVSMKRGNVCDKGIYYMLWPYFGGNNTAPHDITILMKRIMN